jgi:hypothetical protein
MTMTWNGFVEWFFTMGVIVLIFATPWIADLFRHFGDRGGGPPTHPVPVTGPIETERVTSDSEESGSIR